LIIASPLTSIIIWPLSAKPKVALPVFASRKILRAPAAYPNSPVSSLSLFCSTPRTTPVKAFPSFLPAPTCGVKIYPPS